MSVMVITFGREELGDLIDNEDAISRLHQIFCERFKAEAGDQAVDCIPVDVGDHKTSFMLICNDEAAQVAVQAKAKAILKEVLSEL